MPSAFSQSSNSALQSRALPFLHHNYCTGAGQSPRSRLKLFPFPAICSGKARQGSQRTGFSCRWLYDESNGETRRNCCVQTQHTPPLSISCLKIWNVPSLSLQRDHRRCVLVSKSCKDAKSRLPKLLKLAKGLGNLSSSDVWDRIFLPLGQGKRQIFHWGTG